MGKPMADYVKLPEFDEYKEWFRDFADLKREDGIVQVTWKTLDGPMHHSGMSHRAMSQLTRWLSLDFKNEIIIYTHIGDNWMIESDANGWETYSELPTQRFQHQYFDDTNLIKNMVFDLDVPTIGAIPGPGFHWDSAMLCDITLCSEDTKMEVPHAQGGLVPGDGMGLMCQHYFGTKRGNYYMMTSRQFTARQMLEWGMVNEVLPKGKVLERAWEIARKYLMERQQFGKPLCKQQTIAFKMAELAIEIEQAKYMVYKAALEKGEGQPYSISAAKAKYCGTNAAMHVTTEAVQLLGGNGYMKEYHVERMMRDAKITQIYEGTNEIQKMIVSGTLFK